MPRSVGVCTRCPLQITLISSAEEDNEWTCEVSLQHKYSFDPKADITKQRYGKWSEKPAPTTTPFTTVKDKAELQQVISRAQWATLNPGDSSTKYLNADFNEEMSLKVDFSPNKVILEIKVPSQPNLSFIDLPGIIRQTESAEDKWLVQLVENFVEDYISQGNSLILLARSMESDFANSSAAALIDQCNALRRTVGCLTKPDRLPEGTRMAAVQNVLSGAAFTVGHGYFVTRQPHQGQLDENITPEEARDKENSFFAQEPWISELAAYNDRFGTIKLRDSLSVKLTQQILDSLPDITSKVNDRLHEVEQELSEYPDPPDNALGRVMEALLHFRTLVEQHLKGEYPYNDFRNSLKDRAKDFGQSLEKLRPTMTTTTPGVRRSANRAPFANTRNTSIVLSDDEEEQETLRRSVPRKKAVGDTTPCPTSHAKRRRASPEATSSSKKVKVDPTSSAKPAPRPTMAPGRKTFDLSELRDSLRRLTTSDVPGLADPRAVDSLRQATLAAWETPMLEFIDSVNKEIQTTLQGLLEEACSQWLTTAFFIEAQKIVRVFASSAMLEQLKYAKRALDLEQRKPFTLNTDSYKFQCEHELNVLQEARTTQRLIENLKAENVSKRLALDNEDITKKAKTDMKARAELGEDPFKSEVGVMASVKGYYNVASVRFLESIVQGVQIEVLHNLITKLPEQLELGLEIKGEHAHEHCKELLAEDRNREIRRVSLKKERNNLIEAQHKLARLGQTADQNVAYPS